MEDKVVMKSFLFKIGDNDNDRFKIEGKPKMKTTDFLRGYRGITHGIVT